MLSKSVAASILFCSSVSSPRIAVRLPSNQHTTARLSSHKYTERRRFSFEKARCNLLSHFQNQKKTILTIGVNFEELGFHRGFYLFGIFFLSVVCDKACQSVSSTQQAEGQPPPLTCFIYLGVSSRGSKKFNEFDACLLAISKKSRKMWNYLFPQVMSTWRNISKEGK